VRPIFGSLYWTSSAKQKARTNLVNDSVVGAIMSDDFSDISDGEVVSATQLTEDLYGDDTDSDLVQPGKVSPGDRLRTLRDCKSQRWTSYVVPKPSKCGSKTQSV